MSRSLAAGPTQTPKGAEDCLAPGDGGFGYLPIVIIVRMDYSHTGNKSKNSNISTAGSNSRKKPYTNQFRFHSFVFHFILHYCHDI